MLDFQAIKASVSILDVANGLGLKLKQEKDQFRTACPACEGDPRSIVITPEKNLFYCFASSKGGDQISLMAHIRGLSMKEAAAELAPGQQPEPKPEPKKGFDAKKYLDGLKPVEELPEELQKQVGIGRAVKGAHAGKVVVALRDSTGAIIVFASVTDLKLPAKWGNRE